MVEFYLEHGVWWLRLSCPRQVLEQLVWTPYRLGGVSILVQLVRLRPSSFRILLSLGFSSVFYRVLKLTHGPWLFFFFPYEENSISNFSVSSLDDGFPRTLISI